MQNDAMPSPAPRKMFRFFWALPPLLFACLASLCLCSDGVHALLCFAFPVFLCLSSVFAVRLLQSGDRAVFLLSVAVAVVLSALLSDVFRALLSLGGFVSALVLSSFIRHKAGKQVGAVCALMFVNCFFFLAALLFLSTQKYRVSLWDSIGLAYDAFSGLVLRFTDFIIALQKSLWQSVQDTYASADTGLLQNSGLFGSMSGSTGSVSPDDLHTQFRQQIEELLNNYRFYVPGVFLSVSAISSYLTVLSCRLCRKRLGLPDALGIYRVSNVSLFVCFILWIPGFFLSVSSVAGCVVHTLLAPLTLGMALQGYLFLYAATQKKGKGWLCILITVGALLITSQIALYALAVFGMMGLWRLFLQERLSAPRQ